MTRNKPQGATGPIRMGPGGVSWEVIEFPGDKAEREQLIANLLIKGFDGYVAMQSEPSLAPFGAPVQNVENDIDFKVTTAAGEKLMELVEFAPLDSHGPKFSDAPKALRPNEKSGLAVKLIEDKSDHQGGENRFLVVYTTEQGFWLDPITIERVRRLLAKSQPNFDRVYYVKPHSLEQASVSELYPGKPHHWFGERTDDQLDRMSVDLPHPTEMILERTSEWSGVIGVNGRPVPARYRVRISGIETLKRH